MTRKKAARGQELIAPGAPMAASLPVFVSMRAPAAPTVLKVTDAGGILACHPVLAVRATLERTYARASAGDHADPPRLATHRDLLKAGWEARELKERLDLVFYRPGRGLTTLAELQAAEPDATVEVVAAVPAALRAMLEGGVEE
jgi:hypothetical protein